MKILVLGAGGMLGSAIFRIFSENTKWNVYGTARSNFILNFLDHKLIKKILIVQDLVTQNSIKNIFDTVLPDIVINCVALLQRSATELDANKYFLINSLLPQYLAFFSLSYGSRLIHISTDGVFSGKKGFYTEEDYPDSVDNYGVSKALGELSYPNTITIRTSIIGHKLSGEGGLLDWFFSQQGQCPAFTRSIFSGFPTNVLAEIIRDVVIPRPQLTGVYHVATTPISKFDLLRLIAQHYGKDIELIPDDKLVMDRSLDAALFCKATGYVPPTWPELIDSMHSYHSNFTRT
jgi:dTDP-4-dehydrorhamnose reductase